MQAIMPTPCEAGNGTWQESSGTLWLGNLIWVQTGRTFQEVIHEYRATLNAEYGGNAELYPAFENICIKRGWTHRYLFGQLPTEPCQMDADAPCSCGSRIALIDPAATKRTLEVPPLSDEAAAIFDQVFAVKKTQHTRLSWREVFDMLLKLAVTEGPWTSIMPHHEAVRARLNRTSVEQWQALGNLLEGHDESERARIDKLIRFAVHYLSRPARAHKPTMTAAAAAAQG